MASRSARRIDATLVFDGDCAFCTRSIEWARRRLPIQPRIAPWQELDLDEFGLTAPECQDALQWVDRRGKESGARAVGRLLLAQGGVWRLVGWPPFVWPFSTLSAVAYRAVARNRYRLPGGTAACAVSRPPAEAAADDSHPDDSHPDGGPTPA